jgi:hypothetical protein
MEINIENSYNQESIINKLKKEISDKTVIENDLK